MFHRTASGWVTAVLAAAVTACPVIAVMASAAQAAAGAPAPVRVTDTPGLRAAIGRARPGTVIELAPGTYAGGLHVTGVRGEAGRPVVIRSAQADQPAVFQGAGLQISGAAYLVLENVVVRGSPGNGLNLDDAGRRGTPAHHLVVRGVVIEGAGPKGNLDGIKLSGLDDFLLERCTVRGWGDGGSGVDMVGCHRGLIHACRLEAKADTAANGVQAKGGSSEIVVRGCTFRDAGNRAVQLGGSTGMAYFRPPGAKYENRRSVALGNVVVGAASAVAFVGTEDSAFLYNTVVRPKRWVLRILQETRDEGFVRCRNNTFAGNLVVWRAGDLAEHVNIGPDTHPDTFTFRENLWYQHGGPPGASRPRLPVEETGGVYGQDPILADRDDPVAPDKDFRAFGHTAPGEAEAWKTLARPMVEWAAGQMREAAGTM